MTFPFITSVWYLDPDRVLALKKVSQRNSVMETKVLDFFSTMSGAIECNHLKL